MIALLPNPANDHVRVITERTMVRVHIIATDGRVMRTMDVRGTTGDVPVQDLSSGSYVLVATLHDGSIARAPFAKQ